MDHYSVSYCVIIQEENEECHVFATAKRKMMRKRIEKEKEMHV